MMNRRNYNPLNDYLFKFVFGREERKRITLSFLNAVLEREETDELTDISFIDREFDPQFEEDKRSQLDIYGITSDGSQINIEVQLLNRHNMQKRTLYYWARMYQTLHKGEEYRDLRRSITINLLNFHLLPQENPHTMYGLYDIQSGHRLTDDLEIHFLEIPKFKIKSIKEMKRLEKWLAYFSNKLDERETEELAMSESAISEAIQAEQIFMQSDVERWQYEQREKALRDYLSEIRATRAEGRAEGCAEGRHLGITHIAMNMLRAGTPLATVSQMAELPEAVIRKMAEEHGLQVS